MWYLLQLMLIWWNISKKYGAFFCLLVYFFFILISSDISWLIVTLRQCPFPQIWRACYKLETRWYGGENRQQMSRAFNLQVFFFIFSIVLLLLENNWMNELNLQVFSIERQLIDELSTKVSSNTKSINSLQVKHGR